MPLVASIQAVNPTALHHVFKTVMGNLCGTMMMVVGTQMHTRPPARAHTHTHAFLSRGMPIIDLTCWNLSMVLK